jgi:tetratricopeptide (TPR) repeat protein
VLGRRLSVTAVLAAAALGCASPTVVRVIDGREVEGRFISEYAYTLYAIGADAEAHKDLATALQAFEAAAQEDAESPQIWSRIGAIRCRGSGPPEEADEAFEEARDLDPDFEPLEREQARCALHRGQKEKALEHAKRAFELDPDSEEPVLLYATLLATVGRFDEAVRLVQELTIRRPSSMTALRELRNFTVFTKNQSATADASRRIAELNKGGRGTEVQADITLGAGAARPEGGDAAALEAVDAALAEGDLKLARKLGRRAHISPAEIAVRAAANAHIPLAREQAELVLGADPSDTSARIALAVAADLARDTEVLKRALAELPPGGAGSLAPPSPLARLLFAELLYRRIGPDAARMWLGLEDAPLENQEPFREGLKLYAPTEPLLHAVLRRLVGSLKGDPRIPPSGGQKR